MEGCFAAFSYLLLNVRKLYPQINSLCCSLIFKGGIACSIHYNPGVDVEEIDALNVNIATLTDAISSLIYSLVQSLENLYLRDDCIFKC